MHLLNKTGDQLIRRKQILLDNLDSLAVEDTTFIINERYYRNNIINDEIKNSIMNNSISIPEFEKILLKYENFRKDEGQIKLEIAKFADKLEEEMKLQEINLTKKDMRVGESLTTINVVKTVSLSKTFMQRYLGLEEDEEMYEKCVSKCIMPFFILRIKKIIKDVSESEPLKSNYIKARSSKPYTRDNSDALLFDFILEIDIDKLEKEECYNETAIFIKNALDYFENYYQTRILI